MKSAAGSPLARVAFSFLGLFLSGGIALAAIQVVVTDPTDGGGPNTLRAQLNQLESAGGGTLSFQIPTGTIVISNVVLPTITVPCTIDGGNTVTISGNNQFRIFNLNFSAAGTVTLKNLTLTKAFVAGDGGAIANPTALGTLVIDNCHFLNNLADSPHSGGAIWSIGPLTITNSEFAGNQAGNGGALFPRFANAVVNITNCTFHDNSTTNTTNGWGGAMLVWDGAQVTVHGSQFFNNMANSGSLSPFSPTIDRGGAIYVTANSSFTADSSQFYSNSACFGGALYVDAGGTLTVTSCDLHDNTISVFDGTQGGGAIYNAGTLTVDTDQLHDNHADGTGGALYNVPPGFMQVRNSVLRHNSASGGAAVGTLSSGSIDKSTLADNTAENYGGAIDCADESDQTKTFTVTASTLSGNSAGLQGGAIQSEMKLTLINVTVSGNTGPQVINHFSRLLTLTNVTLAQNTGVGLRLQSGATLAMSNTLLASNSAGNCSAVFASSGFNIADDTTCGLANTGDRQGPSFDPRLGSLQNNGGPTLTLMPGSGSPAIDNGTGVTAPSTDERGVMRPQGAAVDIGAVEIQRSDISTLANVSTRLPVQTGDNALFAGFIITGTQDKKVAVIGLGPSLSQFFSGVLADPVLELHDGSGTLLESNDNWVDSPNKQAIIDAGVAPSNNLESAIIRTLPTNSSGYTAILRGTNNGTGIGVVEAFDLDRNVDSKLANISTRGLVQTGDNLLIAGTIIVGQAFQKVLICALGPSLPLQGKLADPFLELHDGNGATMESNDNWVDSPNKQAIIDTGAAPPDNFESAIIRTLPANGAQYTAIVRGVNNTTGVAVVEVFALN
ncbi:MAG: choice-of-anchor Q domain-containing protein [Chthoniobacterales bacterium]